MVYRDLPAFTLLGAEGASTFRCDEGSSDLSRCRRAILKLASTRLPKRPESRVPTSSLFSLPIAPAGKPLRRVERMLRVTDSLEGCRKPVGVLPEERRDRPAEGRSQLHVGGRPRMARSMHAPQVVPGAGLRTPGDGTRAKSAWPPEPHRVRCKRASCGVRAANRVTAKRDMGSLESRCGPNRSNFRG
jgi:hypothetical protein